jgi:hypothetical protein
MYVIGRKGTGKSSIYSAIQGMPKSPNYAVAGLTFDKYPWQLDNRIKDETRSRGTWGFDLSPRPSPNRRPAIPQHPDHLK